MADIKSLTHDVPPLYVVLGCARSPSPPRPPPRPLSLPNTSDITGLHFQAAVPKYLRLEMQPASGSVVKAGGAGTVEQIVRVTNSLQVSAAATYVHTLLHMFFITT